MNYYCYWETLEEKNERGKEKRERRKRKGKECYKKEIGEEEKKGVNKSSDERKREERKGKRGSLEGKWGREEMKCPGRATPVSTTSEPFWESEQHLGWVSSPSSLFRPLQGACVPPPLPTPALIDSSEKMSIRFPASLSMESLGGGIRMDTAEVPWKEKASPKRA